MTDGKPGRQARIIAVVRPVAVDDVIAGLLDLAPAQLVVEQVRGYGRQKEHLDFYEQEGLSGGFLPKVRLEFVVAGDDVERAVAAVVVGARTGRLGDGKVFVHEVEPPA